MKRIPKEVGAEVNQSLKEAGETFTFGWKWIMVIRLLFAVWVAESLSWMLDVTGQGR